MRSSPGARENLGWCEVDESGVGVGEEVSARLVVLGYGFRRRFED